MKSKKISVNERESEKYDDRMKYLRKAKMERISVKTQMERVNIEMMMNI